MEKPTLIIGNRNYSSWSLRTYGVSPGGIAGEYMDAVWALPAMQDWAEKASGEKWSVKRYDR